MSSKTGQTLSCKKNDDGTCTKVVVCQLETPEGKRDCECVCTCRNGNCGACVCDCKCTLETAQKIQTEDGVKYRCECTCDC